MDKLCIDSSGCKYIKKGSIYACKTDGRYTVINGRKYLSKRFTERIHEPTPKIVYKDLLIPFNYEDLNKLNNEINAKRRIEAYETENIKNLLCGRVRNDSVYEPDREETNGWSWWNKVMRLLFIRNSSSD